MKHKLKKGMTIRLSDDLSATRKLWGMNDHMLSMKGTVRKVTRVAEKVSRRTGNWSTCVYLKDDRGSEWTFSPKNIEMIELKPIPPQPILFDPKHIDTGE